MSGKRLARPTSSEIRSLDKVFPITFTSACRVGEQRVY
jgi:hypothetical protein